ncbi:hypothetical protein Egran_05760 [Elaphomyces granulatus]|uniref:Sulphur transport domain-containing protein n=1 Tax=Elaphomyces granulatus TaxID=519963 RepID=A0A232LQN1_9EURO|nr:hypothetical protein Egran_05760 [Elaphomyces granulatus]
MFTPVHTSLGALLLFNGSFGLLIHNGEVFGISSILSGSVFQPSLKTLPIVAGLLSSLGTVYLATPSLRPNYPDAPSSWTSAASTLGLGLLVGWGTKNGKGCTSGHMLCGLSRLSPRSLIATSLFFSTAVVTANVMQLVSSFNIIPPCDGVPCYTPTYPSRYELIFMTAVTTLALFTNFFLVPRVLKRSKRSRYMFAYLAGLELGLGLLITGMTDPIKILRFFVFPSDLSRFDPSLAVVFFFGICPSLVGYLITKPGAPLEEGGKEEPTLADSWSIPNLTVADIDWRFIAGAIAFGLGWGLSGVCPGPALLRAVIQPLWGAPWMGGYILGNLM